MGRIPEHVIDEVRERADIVQIASRYLTLKKSGSRHWGLCPFHSEKTPSFQVHEDKQVFYCFGCGASGDVFAFRMQQDGLDFPDAARALARELGITIPSSSGESSGQVTRLHQVNEAALEYFRSSLRAAEGAQARRYLVARGVSQELLDRFQIGFAPSSWEGLQRYLTRKRLDLKPAEQAGLLARRQTGAGHYDRFRGRIVFPIVEPSGYVIGFGGRALGEDEAPKYLNSQESPIYHKGRVLFGLPLALDAIRRRGRVVVVEGYFDLVALHRAEIEEGVAPCGTALTQDHARRMRRYTEEVVLLFDGDEAGQRAAERALPVLLAERLRVRAAFLPAGEDPDTLLQRSGAEALRAVVDAAKPLLDHMLDRQLQRSSDHAWELADAARAVAPLLRALPDPIESAAYVRLVAARLNVPISALRESLRERPAGASSAPTPKTAPAREVRIDAPARVLLAALVSHPELLPLLDALDTDWLAAGDERELLLSVSQALREHGNGALARLLSPAARELSEPLKSALSRIVAEAEQSDARAAERALRDCIVQLGIRVLDRRSRALTARLESCKDQSELELLLQEKQQYLVERRELWSQVEQV
ncbi:MAG: DNA primase [Myxococcales bacterium]|nr:DNA primase [Myxococcales bacterium]TDJ04462.1 MAG: DNA primase [Deltaproteobacteria bacterium]